MTDVTRADENAAKDLLSIILYAPYPFALRKTAEHFARQRAALAHAAPAPSDVLEPIMRHCLQEAANNTGSPAAKLAKKYKADR